ncbi:MAG: OmpA family protein, partial [Rhodospirillales bacterium]
FQSEVLFDSGSAELGPSGLVRLADVADALKEIADKIPPGIDWILQVDGHTDTKPIRTAQFPSNWELSSARAIAVLEFLHSRGIPYNRLAARGFSEFQPLTPDTDSASLAKNRRIELKITTR